MGLGDTDLDFFDFLVEGVLQFGGLLVVVVELRGEIAALVEERVYHIID